MTDTALTAIEQFNRSGGRMVWAGEYGICDEHHTTRRTPPALPDGPGVVRINGGFESFLAGTNRAAGVELATAMKALQPGLAPTLVRTAGVNVQLHTRIALNGDAFVLHLINRDFAAPSGFRTAGPIEVEFDLPRKLAAVRRFYAVSPDKSAPERLELKPRRIDACRFRVMIPKVAISAVIVAELVSTGGGGL
jgi:hypothetical protein